MHRIYALSDDALALNNYKTSTTCPAFTCSHQWQGHRIRNTVACLSPGYPHVSGAGSGEESVIRRDQFVRLVMS